ncbi:MAG: carboxypeptidase-like regulatory domain-containing protein [Bacteroidales bacterium]|nr:carboxypeptidase-like regulatory domain-containing protein [Bacteroidales bacterium]
MIPAGKIWLLLIFTFSFSKSWSQDLSQYIQLPPQELSVEQYLYHIEEYTKYRLNYSSTIVDNRRIAIMSDSITLKELLDTLFTEHNVHYIFRGDRLFLSPQPDEIEQNFVRVSGNVINERNDKPIAFATVYKQGESFGTITNHEGAFELIFPVSYSIDSLTVSCLGYGQRTVYETELLKGPVTVGIKPIRFQIEELIIRPQDPLYLIKRMLDKKAENYGTEPSMLTAFFRESSTQNDQYISLSEAVVDIYKAPYNNAQRDLVKMRKGRRGTNTNKSEFLNLKVEGGLYYNMQLDIIKYGISFLDPELFDSYTYQFKKQTEYNSRSVYIIEFHYKENQPYFGYNGQLFIDVKTLALVHCSFSLSPGSLGYAQRMLVVKSPVAYRINPKYADYMVEYRYYNGHWNLNHARSELGLKARKKFGSKNKGFSCQFTTSSEFVITGKSEEGFDKIKYRDASKPKDILYEQIAGSDPDYWSNETVIIPEEPLLETIRKLRLNLDDDEQGMAKKQPAECETE